MKILKIVSPQEWGKPLHQTQSLSRIFNPQEYHYYDYIDAWYNTLYLFPKKHSWFIWFRIEILLKFSKRIIKWFVYFRLLTTIFSKPIQDIYTYFKENSSFKQGYKLISPVASQSITYILARQYVIMQIHEGVDIKE